MNASLGKDWEGIRTLILTDPMSALFIVPLCPEVSPTEMDFELSRRQD